MNVVMSFFTHMYGLPVYLDTVGTMFVSLIGGIFPGIVNAVLTNAASTIFNKEAIYRKKV